MMNLLFTDSPEGKRGGAEDGSAREASQRPRDWTPTHTAEKTTGGRDGILWRIGVIHTLWHVKYTEKSALK